MADILIIEDEKAIQTLLKVALKQEGYTPHCVGSANEGIDFVIKNVVDLIILDLGLPDMDGSNVISTIRQFNSVLPIIVVSARTEEQEKIKCLDLGVNDYVQKPFSTGELLARIRALLRYNSATINNQTSVFKNGSLTIDYTAHSVYINDEEVHLTNYEYKILCLLAQNLNKTLTHNYIISNVWGVGGNDANGLRVFMSGIRRKLENNIYEEELIRTDVGVGYRMNKL